MKKYVSLSLSFIPFVILVICIGCGGPKKPILQEVKELSIKSKKKITKISGNLIVENDNDNAMQLLEVYADVTLDGVEVGFFRQKIDALIGPKNSISIGFYKEVETKNISLGEGAIVLKLKGYFKAKVNDTDISNSFNYSKNVIIDARSKDEVNLNVNPSKTEIKEQKKMEKKMKKNEKDKRKFQNQVES